MDKNIYDFKYLFENNMNSTIIYMIEKFNYDKSDIIKKNILLYSAKNETIFDYICNKFTITSNDILNKCNNDHKKNILNKYNDINTYSPFHGSFISQCHNNKFLKKIFHKFKLIKNNKKYILSIMIHLFYLEHISESFLLYIIKKSKFKLCENINTYTNILFYKSFTKILIYIMRNNVIMCYETLLIESYNKSNFFIFKYIVNNYKQHINIEHIIKAMTYNKNTILPDIIYNNKFNYLYYITHMINTDILYTHVYETMMRINNEKHLDNYHYYYINLFKYKYECLLKINDYENIFKMSYNISNKTYI